MSTTRRRYFVNFNKCLLMLLSLVLTQSANSQFDDNDLLLLIPVIMTPPGNGTNTPPPLPQPVDLCKGYRVNDKTNRPMTALSRPPVGGMYSDPAFGSKVIRVTNAAAIPSRIIKTMYNTISAWNADESRLILWHRGDGHHLYHGKTYAHIKKLAIAPADLEQVFWSTTDKDRLVYPNVASGKVVQTTNGATILQGNELVEYNIATDRYRVIRSFRNYCPANTITAGNDVQMIAYNGDVSGFRCGDKGFIYRASTDSIVALTGSANFTAPQSFPSGKLIYHQSRIMDLTLNTRRTLDQANGSEHASLGRLHNGRDALFAVSFDPNPGNTCGDGVGSLVVHDATTGVCRVLVGPSTGYPYTLSGSHPSALAVNNPGWAVVSSIGYGTQGDSLLEQELYLANTDPANPKVCRIAHHRATGRLGSIGYFAEPHPVLSPTGTRVLFSSDWNNSGQVDVFVVETPSYSQ